MTKKNGRNAASIPPPPGLEEGYDAVIAYFKKYDWDDLERAGHLEKVSREKEQEIVASVTQGLLEEEGVHLRLSRKDCERLARFAAKRDIPVETLVKRWIREGLAGSSRKREGAKNKANARR